MPVSSPFMKRVLLTWSTPFLLLFVCSVDVVPTSVFSISCSGQDFKEKSSNVTCVLNKAAIPSTCSIASPVVEIQFCSTSRVGMIYVTYRCDDVSSCPDASSAAEQCHCFTKDNSFTTYRFFFISYSTENEVVWCSIRCSDGSEIKSDECDFLAMEDDHDYYIADDIDDLEKASEKNKKERKKLLTILIPLITGTTMLMLGAIAVWKQSNRSGSGVQGAQVVTVREDLPTPGTQMQSAPSQASPQI